MLRRHNGHMTTSMARIRRFSTAADSPTSPSRMAAERIGGVAYRGWRRKITSPTCARLPNAEIHEKLVLWVAILVAPKMACVKKAKPAYNTATNQRLRLREESASI